MEKETKIIRIYGIVQGVGFRPGVKRLADGMGVTGTVENTGSCVKICASGDSTVLKSFIRKLYENAPSRSRITSVEVEDVPSDNANEDFVINRSSFSGGEIFIPPDIAICGECEKELYEKGGRRYLHPFINCTLCGPRMSILEKLPYDRERTSMKMFPMCENCRNEYENPGNRRFDAQPVCCNECGPVYSIKSLGLTGTDAIIHAREVIISGGSIAIKGIGGFHLCCSAYDDSALMKLREKKHRPAKPFAVMFRDLETAERNCVVTETERMLLTGPEKPVVILKKKEICAVSEITAPDNPTLGVMLPYAPVQLLLFRMDDGLDALMPDCLVMTSGNVSDSPICKDDSDADEYLSGLCDCILTHDREIRTRADDSVTDIYDSRPYMIRRSRGFSPLPVTVPFECDMPSVAAFGCDLKNSLCINRRNMFYLSPYIGDMADIRATQAHRETLDTLSGMLETVPQIIVCDMHPDQTSSINAKEMADKLGIPLVRVQHHYAHILSCMAENSMKEDAKVIGVCFDGTGYGTDGTIWGGEILSCTYSSFKRLSHISPFRQAGGDRAVREGYRIAVSMLMDSFPDPEEKAIELSLCRENEYKMISAMLEKDINCVVSTSAGRLFDAVAAVLGFRKRSTFEGEAACALQYAAEDHLKKEGMKKACDGAFSFISEGVTGTGDLFSKTVSSRLSGSDPSKLAFYFHYGLSALTAKEVLKYAGEEGCRDICLSGGVFQNTLFTKLLSDEMNGELVIHTHSLVPPNDGGTALGQCVHAAFCGREMIDINSVIE
ncbi:MAG: carbamoyltransferase HypF [Lachnospiraceae bacterium]|nr:carbamoyltransferase HypF [Lachnospiraceae bacterium]